MAKKLKKKPRSGQKDNQGSTSLQKAPTEQNFSTKTQTVEDGVVGKEKKVCLHFDKGIDLALVTSKISSAEHIRCEDCKVSVTEKRANKGKSKQGKKRGGSSADSKTIWVCLDCGCFYCGGIGFPTVPQSHAVRHAKHTRHQLAIQFENLRLRWCFPCNTLIPFEKNNESGESNDPFSDIVKVIKGRSTEKATVNVEDVWFGSGSILSEIKSEDTPRLDATSGYLVRGLVNLGNTCFFNSIIQNLLALDRLREHYLEVNEPVGPLAVSLKKIFVESSSASGLRNVINPRSFFGCVCAKAPQFRGFQQHDSHELLRCLLDGLCTEESSGKKRISRENGTSANQEPTFVDAIFGGQLSSTVSCLDCGHSSKVFEPFLDLSLPVPTKRPPSRKANKPISRATKHKLPPKRNARNRRKVSKDEGTSASASSGVPDSSVIGGAPYTLESTESVVKQPVEAVDDSLRHSVVTENKNTGSANYMVVDEIENKQLLETVTDDLSWLDYVEPDFLSNDNDTTSKCNDIAAFPDAGEKYDGQMNESVQDVVDSCSQVLEGTVTKTGVPECSSWLDFVEASEVANDHDIASKVDSVHEESVQDVVDSCSPVLEGTVTTTGVSECSSWLDFVEASEVVNDHDIASKVDSVHEDSSRDEINQSVIGTRSICAESNCSLVNPYEKEQPLQVQGSEVILLPYKEESCSILPGEGEVSSSTIGGEPDSLDFDGFGDLFNEPEIVEGPSIKPISSESDPDEVDNSNSQVSVESCLAYFTKAELLSTSEHGWSCENCSKALHEQRKQSRKKHQKAAVKVEENGADGRVSDCPSGLGPDCSCSSQVQSTSNGCIPEGMVGSKVDDEDANSEKVDPILEAYNFQESNIELTQFPCATNVDDITSDACSANESTIALCASDEVEQKVSQVLAEGSESEESSGEEMNSKSVMVKRDATKRILINKAPLILTIHLKRFCQDARGRLSKLNGHVDFKDIIDLRPYMDPRCKEKDGYTYRLSGVVEHSGTMRGGHYVSYVRGSKKSQEGENSVWYHVSDAHVRQVSLQEVLNCEAYILFYEKI